MKDGHKLFITANYAFNYSDHILNHLNEFDVITQFFEHRNNLQGYVEDEEGPRIEEGSDIDILVGQLYAAFDNDSVAAKVEGLLLQYEMYEVLAEYHSPLDSEAIDLRDKLKLAKQT
jgi:hypothetical protein